MPVGGNGFVTVQVSRGVRSESGNKILVVLPGGLSLGKGAAVAAAAARKAPSKSSKVSRNNRSTGPDKSVTKPGPLHDEAQDTDFNLEELAAKVSAATTIVNLKYRIGTRSRRAELDHRFPTPIHDVFTAFEYITDPRSPHNIQEGSVDNDQESAEVENSADNSSDSTTHGFSETTASDDETAIHQPTICLYSSHIGAALTLSLALTKPLHIHAIALLNPLVDWVILDELLEQSKETHTKPTPPSKTRQKQIQEQTAAARELVKLRTALFRTPSGYFDSFASPVLFLRAPGQDTPTSKTASPVKVDEVRKSLEMDGRLHDFGPYDDDFHAHDGIHENTFDSKIGSYSAINSMSDDSFDSSTHSDSTIDTPSSASSISSTSSVRQEPTDLSYWTPKPPPTPTSATVRRRKVLRRWPPTSMFTPDDLLPPPVLPYTNIFLSTLPSPSNTTSSSITAPIDINPVLTAQAHELTDLLKRACFGATQGEKNVADERVELTLSQPSASVSLSAASSHPDTAARSKQEDEIERKGERESESGSGGDKEVKGMILDWLCRRLEEQ